MLTWVGIISMGLPGAKSSGSRVEGGGLGINLSGFWLRILAMCIQR